MTDRERLKVLDTLGILGRAEFSCDAAERKAQDAADALSEMLTLDDAKSMEDIAAPF
jgi:hypothetical protein